VAIERFPGDVWYFAYGSNLCLHRKEQRTARIREARTARLSGYRLAFNKRGSAAGQIYANIMPDTSESVWGAIYRCRPGSIEQLDGYEGVDSGHYSRETMNVVTLDGETVEAFVYVATPAYVCADGRPTDDYLGHILRGAEQHSLPADYIAQIKRVAGIRKC
jgi:gamma-glutamylcyclotransferase (GGCT)/AIG2-like uncharacterized protein YtfP